MKFPFIFYNIYLVYDFSLSKHALIFHKDVFAGLIISFSRTSQTDLNQIIIWAAILIEFWHGYDMVIPLPCTLESCMIILIQTKARFLINRYWIQFLKRTEFLENIYKYNWSSFLEFKFLWNISSFFYKAFHLNLTTNYPFTGYVSNFNATDDPIINSLNLTLDLSELASPEDLVSFGFIASPHPSISLGASFYLGWKTL